LIGVVLLLSACHDAPRKNPFDPVLTPPVELQVALDDTAGTATLMWTAYVGEQAFAEYWVLRNVIESVQVETLKVIEEVAQTAYVDTSLTPDTAYEYRVAVVNASGHVEPSNRVTVSGYTIDAVRLLSVAGDPASGTIVLRWERYRDSGFEAYQVRRRVSEMLRDTLLFQGADVGDTTFVDTSARADVPYVYTVVVSALGRELESNSLERRLSLLPVEMLSPEFDSETASAALAWTPYQGPRFHAYQVRRRTRDQVYRVVGEMADSSAASFTDRGLLGNTEYVYQVVVLTERGEEVRCAEVTGALHRWLAAWPVWLPDFPTNTPLLRLEKRPEGGVVALRSDPLPGILELDQDGVLVREYPALGPVGVRETVHWVLESNLVAFATDLALAPDGRRIVSLNMPAYTSLGWMSYCGTMQYDSQGHPIWQTHEVFRGTPPDYAGGDEAVVSGEIVLGGESHYTTVSVRSEGEILFTEDFSEFPGADPWGGEIPVRVGPWEFSGRVKYLHRHESGWHALYLWTAETQARRADDTWQDFGLEVDGSFGREGSWGIGPNSQWQIRLGGDTFSQYALTLHPLDRVASLRWIFTPPEESALTAKDATVTVPFTTIPHAHYHLSLEAVDDHVEATISTPVVWSEVYEDLPGWSSVATYDDYVALTLYDRAYTLDASGNLIAASQLDGGVSEIRVWEDHESGFQRIGACFPESHQIRSALVTSNTPAEWFRYMSRPIGPEIPELGGFLTYPLSFDVGPDGRIYVLDAGNARIVVFDPAGQYITHWGSRGDGDGEFNFGRRWGTSMRPEYSGSIAVDDDGYIYVADVGNRRFQKFAP